MKDVITLHQFCFTSLPLGVTAASGWQTFARSGGFDKVDLVEQHCHHYERPRLPAGRTDEQMPVDYGFRYLDDAHACVYRICFAGADEFKRRGNYFAHTLVLSREDLDAIDADVPALLTWARKTSRFYSHADQVIERYRANNFRLETLTVETRPLLAWRERKHERPLIDWLKDSYPEEMIEPAAESALRAALAPAAARRPVVWVGAGAGLDNSQQELDTLFFLFAALPFAWRRLATFSTYRKTLQRGTWQWIGTVLDSPADLSEEQRLYDYYVVNWATPARSSELPPPDCHPWIREILGSLDRPAGRTRVGKASRFADHFLPQPDEAVFEGNGFLPLAAEALDVVEAGREDIGPLLGLLPHVRPNRVAVLDELHKLLKRRLEDATWLATYLGPLVDAYRTALAQNADGLADPRRRRVVENCCSCFLKLAYRRGMTLAVAPLMGELRTNPRLHFLREKLVGEPLAQFRDEAAASPNARALRDLDGLLTPYFRAAPAGDPERVTFYEPLRRSLCERANQLGNDLIESAAETIWPWCKHHVPAGVADLEETLGLLDVIRDRGGPDLVPDYLHAVCRNSPQPDPALGSLRTQHRYLLLLYHAEWAEVANSLPDAWQQLLRELSGARLWKCFWEGAPPAQADRFYRRFAGQLAVANDPEQVGEFLKPYLNGGPEHIGGCLREFLTTDRRPGASEYLALARMLAAAAGRPAPPAYVCDHLLDFLVLCYRDVPTLGKRAGGELLGVAASAVHALLTTPPERWPFYLQLTARLQGEHGRGTFDRPVGGNVDRRNTHLRWHDAFEAAGNDYAEGLFVWCCLHTATAARPGPARPDPSPAAIEGRVLREMVSRPEVVTAEAGLQFIKLLGDRLAKAPPDLAGPLREAIAENLENYERDGKVYRDWVTPGQAGWLLLNAAAPARGDGPPETLAAGLDWHVLAQLHRAAAGPEAQQLHVHFRQAFASLVRDVVRGWPFPLDHWAEVAHALAELPDRGIDSVEAALQFLKRGIDGVRDWERQVFEPPHRKLDLRSQVILAVWLYPVMAPTPFFDVFRRNVRRRPSEEMVPMLACTDARDRMLGAPVSRWLLEQRLNLAGWLWLEEKPTWFVAFLAQAGDQEGRGEPVESPAGCESTGFVVGSFLKGGPGLVFRKTWEERLEWLVAEDPRRWDQIYGHRKLDERRRWVRFGDLLVEGLRGSRIPADEVIRRLRKRQGRLRRR
jgi:hypothetical protein